MLKQVGASTYVRCNISYQGEKGTNSKTKFLQILFFK